MEYLTVYTPVVKQLAKKFSNSWEELEDLEQEGYLKLHKFITRKSKPEEDITTVDWQKQIYVVVRNCMIDYLRRSRNYSKRRKDTNEQFLENVFSTEDYELFESIVRKQQIQELDRVLPSLEKKILQLLTQPTEAYKIFLRKKRAVHSMFYGSQPPNRNLDNMAQFLNIKMVNLLQSLSYIKYVASTTRTENQDPLIFKKAKVVDSIFYSSKN